MKKGLTVVGLLAGFIVFFVYLAFLPGVEESINSVLPFLDPTTALFVSLFPVFLLFIIIQWIDGMGTQQQEVVA